MPAETAALQRRRATAHADTSARRGPDHREDTHGSPPLHRRHRRRGRRTLDRAPAVRPGRLSLARRHADQSVPAGRRCRRRRPAARRRARADPQAARRDRHQGGRGRRGRRPGRRQRQARRLHAAGAHRLAVGLRRGRPPLRPPGQVHQRRLHSDRAADRRSDGAAGQRPGALQDAEGAGRRGQGQAGLAAVLLVGPARRAASADRAVPEGGRHQDEAPADQRRRPRADRADRQQLAGARVLVRGRQRADQGRQGARARLVRRQARSATIPTCRP